MCFILVVNLATLYKSKSKCKTNRQSTFRIAQRKRETERERAKIQTKTKRTHELPKKIYILFDFIGNRTILYWAVNFQMVDFYFYLMVFLAVLSLKCSISHKNAVELLAFPSKINIKPNLITFDAGRKKIHLTAFAFRTHNENETATK